MRVDFAGDKLRIRFCDPLNLLHALINFNMVKNVPSDDHVETYLPTLTGWVYLAVVLDLYRRKVVGWAISNSLETKAITDALRQAIERRRPATNKLLNDSDRGCQYTSEAFQGLLKTMQITCSMSRTSCCYDNAVAERFFWSLKHEWTNNQAYRDLCSRLEEFLSSRPPFGTCTLLVTSWFAFACQLRASVNHAPRHA
ncbi:MAG: transposase [Pirellula sp.]